MRTVLASLAFFCLGSAAYPVTIPPYSEVTLRGGVEQTIPDTGITLMVTRIDDQRCPAGVDCIWEGMIRAEIIVRSEAKEVTQIRLCNRCEGASDIATTAGMTFGLVGLAPSQEELAKLGREPTPADYELTIGYGPSQ